MRTDLAVPGGNATLHPVVSNPVADYVQNFARERRIKPCEAVARIAGFRNYEQYRQAKFACKYGTSELIDAWNSGKIATYNAAFLARWPAEAQRDIVALDKREIVRWVKRLRMALRQQATEARP